VIVEKRLVGDLRLCREESLDMLVSDFFDGDIFAQIPGEFIEGIDIVADGMLAQMSCPDGEQIPLDGLREGDFGHVRLQLR